MVDDRAGFVMMRVDLAGRVAFITGAAGGIGSAMAQAFAANGASVAVVDINGDGAEAVAAGLPDALALRMDVRDTPQIEAAVAAVMAKWGRLDILINNAGVNTASHRVHIDQFPVEEWDRIVSIDLDGLFLVSRVAMRPMLERGDGRVINIASVAGLVPMRLQSAFVAAKAAVVNVTKAMAIELGSRGVLTNAIAPGSTLTEGTRKLFYGNDGSFAARMRDMLAHIPLGRPAETSEIAAAALFLADPEQGYVNGHVLTVDGGWTAGYMM
jgi:3-oxoacyl-[acyl-carrier protein] reductase/2-deoxy-D-gluconate 3-dehydrogenase